MTTKVAILSTIGILSGAMLLGLIAMFLLLDPGSRNVNERAASLGQGVALLSLIPIGVVWILWAGRFRADRERKQRLRS